MQQPASGGSLCLQDGDRLSDLWRRTVICIPRLIGLDDAGSSSQDSDNAGARIDRTGAGGGAIGHWKPGASARKDIKVATGTISGCWHRAKCNRLHCLVDTDRHGSQCGTGRPPSARMV